MDKHKRKKAKKSHIGVIIAIVFVINLVILTVFVMPQVLYKIGDENINSESVLSTQEENETVKGVENLDDSSDVETESMVFPVTLEGGKLEIESVFQYDGMNPDCGNQEGQNIAAITVKNLSDTYLESANISVTTVNDVVLEFVVSDLPSGKSVIAFSQENTSIEADAAYSNIACEVVFDTDASMKDDQISLSVEGTLITLQNNTSNEISNIVVHCHSTLGDQYFGGIAYEYALQNLPINETAEIDAADCILGLAEVVRITINEP